MNDNNTYEERVKERVIEMTEKLRRAVMKSSFFEKTKRCLPPVEEDHNQH